jgi:hypothetical protein
LTISPLALYGISIVLSFVVWGIITTKYIWPSLRIGPRTRSLQPLLLLHCFRFVGVSFLIPGVVRPDLSIEFARPAAYGDFIAAILALLSLAVLQKAFGIILVWALNLWGTADLLHAFYQGIRIGLEPGQLGAAYFIITVLVPLLMITHGLMFRILLMKNERQSD